MKFIVIVLVWSLFSIVANAQNDSLNINYQPTGTKLIDNDYIQMKHFLLSVKNDPDSCFVKINPKWNSKLYQKQFEQWYTINRKKELAPAMLINKSSVIQTMPTGYYIKDLKWVSPAKLHDFRNSDWYQNLPFGKQVATDIMYNVASGLLSKKKNRYRYSAAENNKPYSTPSYLKF